MNQHIGVFTNGLGVFAGDTQRECPATSQLSQTAESSTQSPDSRNGSSCRTSSGASSPRKGVGRRGL